MLLWEICWNMTPTPPCADVESIGSSISKAEQISQVWTPWMRFKYTCQDECGLVPLLLEVVGLGRLTAASDRFLMLGARFQH